MWRMLGRWCGLWGCILLSLVASLAYARRDDPPDWLIYTYAVQSSLVTHINAILPDGTHRRTLAVTNDREVSVGAWPERDGWLLLQDTRRGTHRLAMLHLNGHIQRLAEGKFAWASPYGYDDEQNSLLVYLSTGTLDSADNAMWRVDLDSGEHQEVPLSLPLYNLVRPLNVDTYVAWSGDAHGGDFYRIRLGQTTPMTPITMRGDVYVDRPNAMVDDWLYFFAGSRADLPRASLYRMREDGTDEQLVADSILMLDNTYDFGLPNHDYIYYWQGDWQAPEFVRANPDGSNPVVLPVTPTGHDVLDWTPDYRYIYYRQSSYIGAQSYLLPELWVMDMQTGENHRILHDERLMQVSVAADGQWLFVVMGGKSLYSDLYRVRPDGSELTLVAEGLSAGFTKMSDARLVAFTTFGQDGYRMRILNKDTLEIRTVNDHLPPYRTHRLLSILPTPDSSAASGWLIGIGMVGLILGLVGTFWRRA